MFQAKYDEINNVWSSYDAPNILNPNISIGHVLLKSMKLNATKIAQISDDTGEQLRFNEIRLNTIRVAQNLQQRGFKTKQMFGIISNNVAHLSSVVFASFCLGCPVVALHPKIEKHDLLDAIQVTQPSAFFCEASTYDSVRECLSEIGVNVQIFTFSGVSGDSVAVDSLLQETGIEEEFIPSEIDGTNHIAAILSSSGTTGKSKQICLSHAALISHLDRFDIVNGSDIFFTTSTIFWITGFLCVLIGTINGATRIITKRAISPEVLMHIIEKYRVSVVHCSPIYLNDALNGGYLSKTDLSNVRHVIIGGWRTPSSIVEEVNSYLPNGCVNNGYGFTEASAYVSLDFPNCSGNETVGRLLNGFMVKIIDENGNRCGINDEGEICVKDRYKFLGYYGNNKLFDEAIDNEGFFLTGDIGRFDERGLLYITDRKNDVISYIDWVWPSQIENVLHASNDIEAACAVGVPYDEIIEYPVALVVRKTDSNITEEDICKIVEDKLGDRYKLRGGVYFVDAIPKNVNGKVVRRKAQEIAKKFYEMKLN